QPKLIAEHGHGVAGMTVVACGDGRHTATTILTIPGWRLRHSPAEGAGSDQAFQGRDVAVEGTVAGDGRGDCAGAVASAFEGGASREGREQVERAGGGEGLDGEDGARVAHDALELQGGGHPHTDEILLVAAGRDGAGRGGVREHAILRDERGGGDL